MKGLLFSLWILHAVAAQPLHCAIDTECEENHFCSRLHICEECISCDRYHRVSLYSCPTSAAEGCGNCTLGFIQASDDVLTCTPEYVTNKWLIPLIIVVSIIVILLLGLLVYYCRKRMFSRKCVTIDFSLPSVNSKQVTEVTNSNKEPLPKPDIAPVSSFTEIPENTNNNSPPPYLDHELQNVVTYKAPPAAYTRTSDKLPSDYNSLLNVTAKRNELIKDLSSNMNVNRQNEFRQMAVLSSPPVYADPAVNNHNNNTQGPTYRIDETTTLELDPLINGNTGDSTSPTPYYVEEYHGRNGGGLTRATEMVSNDNEFRNQNSQYESSGSGRNKIIKINFNVNQS